MKWGKKLDCKNPQWYGKLKSPVGGKGQECKKGYGPPRRKWDTRSAAEREASLTTGVNRG